MENRQLILPSENYGPFCSKILLEFIAHHNLPNLPTPNIGDTTRDAISKIFDIILHSMGNEKRDAILKDLDKYNMSLPAFFRSKG